MRPWSAVELKRLVEAERIGAPFIIWRDASGTLCIRELSDTATITIGRRSSNDVALTGDGEVSRLHARLELLGEEWTLVDDGLSRNGTFVNGERLSRRRRLADGDALRLGSTSIVFRSPRESTTAVTAVASTVAPLEDLTTTQRRILVALCRPYHRADEYPRPATNAEIAAEVFLGVDAVKSQLRHLYKRFGLGSSPQNEKRTRLAAEVVQAGLVIPGES